jgi:hypothetical protein
MRAAPGASTPNGRAGGGQQLFHPFDGTPTVVAPSFARHPAGKSITSEGRQLAEPALGVRVSQVARLVTRLAHHLQSQRLMAALYA